MYFSWRKILRGTKCCMVVRKTLHSPSVYRPQRHEVISVPLSDMFSVCPLKTPAETNPKLCWEFEFFLDESS